MPILPPNRAHTVDIDTTGEVATFVFARPADAGGNERLVELFIDGTASASYQVEFGARFADEFTDRTDEPGDVKWYGPTDYAYPNTTSEARSWYQAAERIRLVVTSAATAGATADILVTAGE